MIIRETPKNKDKYIAVSSDISNVLHLMGFTPKYIDEEYIYYVKSEEILKIMEKGGLLNE